jgi:hypothetical protein
MFAYSKAAVERAMKIQEVLLRAMARKITWWQAAEILGLSDRHVRRIREGYQCGRSVCGERENRRAWGCGKDASRKSPKTDFPALPGNPAKCAGFPLCRCRGGGWLINLNRTFHLLPKSDILICYQYGTNS